MKGLARILVLVSSLFMSHKHLLSQDQSSSSPARVRSSFQFKLSAPLKRTAPLFGPEGERCWAGQHWDPQFLYPQPAKDIHGAIFTVQHGSLKSVWVNTLFDLSGGRIQYVSFIPDALVSTVDVRLTALKRAITGVEVTYTRTALSAAANDHVHALAASDSKSGPQWQEAIQACIDKHAPPSIWED
jgi:hypothetical protein